MALKAQRAALGEVVHDAAAVATRWTLDRLGKAWDGFFARVAKGGKPGFPRFRAAARWRTWGCSKLADGALLRPTGKVIGSRALGFLGVPDMDRPLAVRMHRMLPEDATVRSCTFTRDRASGRWTVALARRLPVTHGCETDAQLTGVAEAEMLGYDAGVAFQATDAEGRRYPNARHGARRAALVRLALEGGCRVVAREVLAVLNMMRSAAGLLEEPGVNVGAKPGLDHALADAAMARFARDVEGRAERAGLRVVAVDPRRTSLTCSGCGVADARSPGPRTFQCVGCGMTMDRDRNAAVNVRCRAVARFAPRTKKPAARRGRRSCASEPGSAVPALGRDGAKPRRHEAAVPN